MATKQLSKQLEETIRHRERRMDCHNEQATKHKATIATLEAKVTDIDNNRTWCITDRLYCKQNSETLQELYNEEQTTSKKQEARIELPEKQKKGLEEQANVHFEAAQLHCKHLVDEVKRLQPAAPAAKKKKPKPHTLHTALRKLLNSTTGM